jgi:hypothetical protein
MCLSRKVAILLALMTLGKFVRFGGNAFGVQLFETLVFLCKYDVLYILCESHVVCYAYVFWHT